MIPFGYGTIYEVQQPLVETLFPTLFNKNHNHAFALFYPMQELTNADPKL